MQRIKIEQKIKESLCLLGGSPELKDACEKALLNGGKRIRPFIVLELAQALAAKSDVWYAAFAVECFHTASLIADDLPCMDDELYRRNAPSLHRSHGESTALLASYVLISLAYRCIYLAAKAANNPDLSLLALDQASSSTMQAAEGQFLDLEEKELNLEELITLIQGKTGALYELSFVFAWIFGGGAVDLLPQVKELAAHFGMAFQIADDFDDYQEDLAKNCKSNLVLVLGPEKAHQVFQGELSSFRRVLALLKLPAASFEELLDAMEKKSLLKPGL